MPEQPGALSVIGWPDPVIDRLGHDPRSAYVERFWLAILGPSTTWLLRRLAAGLDASPDGFDLNLAVTARSLGLGGKVSRHGPFQKSIGRLVIFELASHSAERSRCQTVRSSLATSPPDSAGSGGSRRAPSLVTGAGTS